MNVLFQKTALEAFLGDLEGILWRHAFLLNAHSFHLYL